MNLPVTLREARRSNGLTQAELARQAGVSLPTIQNLEAGKGNPAFETLSALLEALGLRLEARAREADWDLLAACGAPLFAKPSRTEATSDILARALRECCRELSSDAEIPDRDRKRDALQALLLAIRSHYPAFYASRCRGQLIERQYPRKPDGRLLKLRRIALARLAEYL